MTKIRIRAAVVDTRNLRLYLEDGSTEQIPQGDPRVARILAESKDDLLNGRIAEVDIGEGPETKAMKEFQESTGGFVKFFKTTKKAISSIFGASSEPGETEEPAEPLPEMVLGQVTPNNIDNVLDQIMENAQPVYTDEVSPDETIVAVVEDKVIPGTETLTKQIDYANKMGSTKGVENFFKRIAAVIDARRHSVEDLLKFMEKGDLPIADDGSIIIYKILNQKGEGYVDCHTGKVPQRVGSLVCMDPSLVDPDRRNQCSNGLHVARRSYLRSFSGNVCVIAKVAPEDVIAVPSHDANKMRVCGYHILFELTDAMYAKVKAGKKMTDHSAGQTLLARAISGDHEAPHEKVVIGGNKGTNITIEPMTEGKQVKAPKPRKTKEKAKSKKKTPAKKAKAIDIRDREEKKTQAPKVSPAEISKQVNKAKAGTRAEQVAALLRIVRATARPQAERQKAAQDLLDLRKKIKKSWKALGQPEVTDDQLQSFINTPAPKAKAKKGDKSTKKTAGKKMTRAERARSLFDQADWLGLSLHKQTAKVSWAKLGFTADEERKIKKNLP